MKHRVSLRFLMPLALALAMPAIARPVSPGPVPATVPPASPPQPARPGAAASASPAPAQQAALEKQNVQMQQAALRVAQLVDANRAGEVWDGASPVAHSALARDAFVGMLAADRARVGTLVSRGQPSVSRVKYGSDAAVPAGLYVSVTFPTRFANGPQPVRELVSFRLDEDQVWRVSGYSLRPPGA